MKTHPPLLTPFYLLVCLARLAVEVPLYLIGFPLVFVLAHTKFYERRRSLYGTNKDGSPREILAWRGGWLFWLWGNEKDGIDGHYFNSSTPFGLEFSLPTRIWRWAALRNPVSNIRHVPVLNPVLVPGEIRAAGNCMHTDTALRQAMAEQRLSSPWFWTFCRQGVYAGFHAKKVTGINTHHNIAFGWQIHPVDATFRQEAFRHTARWPRCGVSIHFTLNKTGK